MRLKINVFYLVSLLFLGVLAGCMSLTPYEWAVKSGGFSHQEVGEGKFEMVLKSFQGTDQTKAPDVMMYHCAQNTVDRSYDYFIIESESDKVVVVEKIADRRLRSNIMSEHIEQKPSTITERTRVISHTITMYKGTKPEGNPKAHDARALLAALGPEINKKEKK